MTGLPELRISKQPVHNRTGQMLQLAKLVASWIWDAGEEDGQTFVWVKANSASNSHVSLILRTDSHVRKRKTPEERGDF